MNEPIVVGVRHHSPACARLVAEVIARERPTHVLVEGPVDFNGRLDELLLEHELPVAIYSYQRGAGAAWTPFCEYSPEYQALRAGREVGAELLFIDLPAWRMGFVPNRYRDRKSDAMERLARSLGYDDWDALWDAAFEQGGGDLVEYFALLREGCDEEDREREEHMADCLAWAVGQGGRVVVVCGGFHAPFLSRAWRERSGTWPEPAPAEDTGSYLVPFSFKRLDSFTGYAAGMPSPGYYQALWEHGFAGAARHMLARVAARMRERKQVLSAADLVAAAAGAEALARLRGHRTLLRCDLLDGLAGALLKEALHEPHPWSRRGVLSPGTDPVLVEIVAAFSGEAVGRLHTDTPRPPLVAEVMELLRQHDLSPSRPPRSVRVEAGSLKSHLLHRLAVLRLPGFTRLSGPGTALDPEPEEEWALAAGELLEPALIEASGLGASLEEAARALFEQMLAVAEGASALAALLSRSVQCGFELELLDRVARAVEEEQQLGELGTALEHLWGLGRARAILQAGFARGLWLVEAQAGLDRDPDLGVVQAVRVLRELHRSSLELDRPLAAGVMQRVSAGREVPPDLRGAALGYLWSLGLAQVERLDVSPPERLGDLLAGLFVLAREEVQHSAALLGQLDDTVGELDTPTFLRALPGLRLAFAQLSPQERASIARHLAVLHQVAASDLTVPSLDPGVMARAMALGQEVEQTVARFGLEAAFDGEA